MFPYRLLNSRQSDVRDLDKNTLFLQREFFPEVIKFYMIFKEMHRIIEGDILYHQFKLF